MATRDHEDITRTAGPAFLRGAFAKDTRILDTLCLGQPHSCSRRRTHDRDFEKEIPMESQNKGATNRIRGPDDVRVSVHTGACLFSH